MRTKIVSLLLIVAMILGLAVVSSAQETWAGADQRRFTFESDSDYSGSIFYTNSDTHRYGIKGLTGSRFLAIDLGDATAKDGHLQFFANTIGAGSFTWKSKTCFDTSATNALTLSIALSTEDDRFIPKGNLQFKYYDDAGSRLEQQPFTFGNDGVVKSNNSATVLGTIKAGQWLNLTVAIDFAEKTYTYYVNGEKVLTEGMKGFNGGYIECFNVYPSQSKDNVNDSLYVDNLAVSYDKVTDAQYADYYAKHFDASFTWQEYKDFTGANLALGEDLTFKVYAKLSAAYADAVTEFTVGEETVSVAGVKTDGKNEYVFALTSVTPQMMATPITATMKKGETVLDSHTMSVEEYLLDLMRSNANDAALCELCMATLEYGAEAIKYVDYPVDTELSSSSQTAVFNMDAANGGFDKGGFDAVDGDDALVTATGDTDHQKAVYAKSCRNYNRIFFRDSFGGMTGAKAGDTFMFTLDCYLKSAPAELTANSTIQLRTSYVPNAFSATSCVSTSQTGGVQRMDYVVPAVGEWFTVTYYATVTQEMMDDLATMTYGKWYDGHSVGAPYDLGFVLIVAMTGSFGQHGGSDKTAFSDYGYVEMYFDNLTCTKLTGLNVIGEAESFRDVVEPAVPQAADSIKAAARTSDALYVSSAQLVYDRVNRIQFNITGDTAGKTVVLNGTEVTPVNGKVVTEDISVADFDKAFTLEIKDGQTVVASAAYSVNSACVALQNSATDGALVKALYNYGVAAKNYIGG